MGASLLAQLIKNLPASVRHGSIPKSGRSPGEGIDYPLENSWASLVTQMIKNSPAMQETWVWTLGWEDPLEESIATHSRIPAWRIPIDRGAWWATVHELAESQTWLRDWTELLGLSSVARIFSCGLWDLVPWPRTKPWPLALEAWSLNHWATSKVPL